jgi:hypothetical protein
MRVHLQKHSEIDAKEMKKHLEAIKKLGLVC